ncbi:MAG: TolC family protein, partial [Phycisphaerales bacterium]
MRSGRSMGTVVAGAALILSVVGCASPFSVEGDQALRRRVAGAIDRELAEVPPGSQLIETTQPPPTIETELASRREELDTIGPVVPFAAGKLTMGTDLAGEQQLEVSVSLQSAIETSVRNNLSIQIARLQPAINESTVVAAEAAFDAVFFTNVDWSSTDQPQAIAIVGGTPIGVGAQINNQFRFDTGVRKRLTSGAEVFVSTELSRFNNKTPGVTLLPDPSWNASINLGITQPLLRGFGASVNTATIRIARNIERRSVQQLRSDLLLLLEQVEAAYWNLVFAWQELATQEWLLEAGIEVRDAMDRRRDFDTKLAQYSDAVATVETRKANIISARRAIRSASDNLKLLINDGELTVGSEGLLVPSDDMVEAPIRYNLREAVLTGVAERPEVEAAILNIDDAGIRQMLADNNRLPLLNLSAQMGYYGLSTNGGDAYSELFKGSFIDYLLGLAFEWPIGNRAAEAGFRRARLQRSASVIAYQRTVQRVVFDVKDALRDCITNYELIEANRSSRIAAAENLRTLKVEEETLAALTPEFLNLKFQRQDRLAQAQSSEIQALVNYNQSVASLYRAMGIGLAMNRIELEIVNDIDPDDVVASTERHA